MQSVTYKFIYNHLIITCNASQRQYAHGKGVCLSTGLGTDRWAAVIGAWSNYHCTCIIVNAGTTITIDVITANTDKTHANFIGGLIMPGLMLMQTSLNLNTAQLSDFTQTSDKQAYNKKFGTNTKAAIQNGVINAIAGAVKHASDSVKTETQEMPFIIFTGGDGETIAQYYENTHYAHGQSNQKVIPHLVLMGLFALSNTQQAQMNG